jgi:GTP cyclohydrolase I
MALTQNQKEFIQKEIMMEKNKLTNEQKKFIKERFNARYTNFSKYLKEYESIDSFAPNGNIFDNQSISDEAHFIMRTLTQYHLTEAFKAMKIDLTDDNVAEVLDDGNIGTPGRIAKVWCGDGTHDDRELGSGRWAVKPRLASFPNTGNKTIPITKRVDIISNCSHHFITFSTLAREDAYAIISYIPDKHVLGISKLQRVANWVSQRFFLQEDLTKMLYDEVSKVAETDSVLVAIVNAVHGCESFRGAKANDGSFTSEYYGGAFENTELRNSVLSNV